MLSLSRRSGLLLASAAAITTLTVVASPAALAGTTATTSAAFASSGDLPRCTPAHWGRDWLWHDGHWDHWEWDRWSNHAVWKHYRRDDSYCVGDQGAEASPRRQPDS